MDTNTRPARRPARFSLVGGLRGFLAAAGVAGAFATAAAQPPRAAGLLPPQPLGPGEVPPLARGSIDAPSPVITPVVKPGPRTPTGGSSGPAWLNGVDPNVTPASGTGLPGGIPLVNRAVPSPTPTVPRPTVTPAPQPKPAEKAKAPAPVDQPGTPEPPNAATPFRGTAANGAPVFAGPPAYRWYGYGTVTPGANQFAPTGQYPKASANWYQVTGATPGAFPVPVMNPLRSPAGAEPPAYAAAPATRTPTPAPVVANTPLITSTPSPLVNAPPPASAPVITPAAPPPAEPKAAGPVMKFEPSPPTANEPPKLGSPAPPAGPPLNFLPTAPAPTAPISAPVRPEMPAAPMPAAPVPVPALTPAPALGPVAPPMPQPAAVTPAEPVTAAPLAPPVGLVPAIGPATPAAPAVPAPVAPPVLAPVQGAPLVPQMPRPASPDVRWQPTGETPAPPEGTWAPGGTSKRTAPATEPLARGQVGDAGLQPDPVGDLIRGVCKGRANGVEVRWTGSRRLTVCFESPNQAEAAKLVHDLSARPELKPLQIDFAVLVK